MQSFTQCTFIALSRGDESFKGCLSTAVVTMTLCLHRTVLHCHVTMLQTHSQREVCQPRTDYASVLVNRGMLSYSAATKNDKSPHGSCNVSAELTIMYSNLRLQKGNIDLSGTDDISLVCISSTSGGPSRLITVTLHPPRSVLFGNQEPASGFLATGAATISWCLDQPL